MWVERIKCEQAIGRRKRNELEILKAIQMKRRKLKGPSMMANEL